MNYRCVLSIFVGALVAMSAHAEPFPNRSAAIAEVTATEIAFAKAMADRDFTAFGSFVADDAVFLNNGEPLRGKAAVLADWKQYFETPAAPFSWVPELVEVTGSGVLGQSTGPVRVADGKVVARFYSTWRRNAAGQWQIVFDNGYKACE